MSIVVTGVHQAPDAQDKVVTTLENTSYTLQVSDFPFTDVDNDDLQNIIVTQVPTGGTLRLNGNTVLNGDPISKAAIAGQGLVFTPTSALTARPMPRCSTSCKTPAARPTAARTSILRPTR